MVPLTERPHFGVVKGMMAYANGGELPCACSMRGTSGSGCMKGSSRACAHLLTATRPGESISEAALDESVFCCPLLLGRLSCPCSVWCLQNRITFLRNWPAPRYSADRSPRICSVSILQLVSLYCRCLHNPKYHGNDTEAFADRHKPFRSLWCWV